MNDSMYLPDDTNSTGCGSVKYEERPESFTYPRKTAYDLAPIWKEFARPKRKKVVSNRIVTYLPEIEDSYSDSSSVSRLPLFTRRRKQGLPPGHQRRLRFNDFDVTNPELLDNVSVSLASGIDSVDLNATNEFDDQYISDISEPSVLYDLAEDEEEGGEEPCRNRSMS